MIIKKPTVGPILGWTTAKSVRLWVRGEQSLDNSRTFGVARIARICQSGSRSFGTLKVFEMMPCFDFTGIVDFDDLSTNQCYEYQIGYIFADGEPDHADYYWKDAAAGSFRTAVPDSTPATSFVFGSCRYLLRSFVSACVGIDNRGDQTFQSINHQIDDGRSTDLLLMVGDQIYADALLESDDQLDEFWSRYRKAFGQQHLRKLMGQVPTYMILDDHEIRNNWDQEQCNKEKEQDLFAAAIHAYECYQFVHGPGFQFSGKPCRSDKPRKLWYTFRHGKSAFFVMDIRTKRVPSNKPPQLIGKEQMEALKHWLCATDGTIKFVVTSVPFFPDCKVGSHSQDMWAGFPEQRLEILNFILCNKVPKVVFLSGDVHCSMVGQLKCSDDPDFLVTSVVSSPFYDPWLPFTQFCQLLGCNSFKLNGPLGDENAEIYKLCGFGKVHFKDNFTRVSTDGDRLKDKLRVEFFGRKGEPLECRTLSLI